MSTRKQDVRIQMRRRKTLDWISENPVLLAGEQGFDISNGKFKIGDGVTRWNQLRYFAPQGEATSPVTQEDLDDHIQDETPHPAYDDGVSLVVLYENAKV